MLSAMQKKKGRVTRMGSVGDGSFSGITKEDLTWKVTFEAGPEGEGYMVPMSQEEWPREEGEPLPGAGGAAGAPVACGVSKGQGTAEVSGR